MGNAIKISDNVEWLKEGNHTFLMSFETGKLFQLNKTAGDILLELSEGKAPSKIARGMANRYDITEEELKSRISEFLGALEKEGIVKEGC